MTRVGVSGKEHRVRPRVRIQLAKDAFEARDQPEIRLSPRRGFLARDLERREATCKPLELGEEIPRREAREHAAVQMDGDLAWDDVDGVAAADHGRRGGVVEQWV